METLEQKRIFFSNRDLRRLIIPLLIEQLLNCTVGLLDSMMVSSVGEAAVSAVSLVDCVNVLLLQVFAVTFIAKTILGSKRPNAPGILIGALVLTVISNAFTLLGLQFYWAYIAQGTVLILAAIVAVSDRSVILQDNLS